MTVTGATMASQVRKTPNVFNLIRQIHVLQKAGMTGVQKMFDDWSSQTQVAKAFQIGRGESSAVVAIMTSVSDPVFAKIKASVRTRGMRGYITHDMLAKGCLNTGWSSGFGEAESWAEILTNKANNVLVSWFMLLLASLLFSLFLTTLNVEHAKIVVCEALKFLDRLESIYDNTPAQLRKAFSFLAASKIHMATGCYLHFVEQLQKQAPSAEFPDMLKSLDMQFASGLLDGDLIHTVESSVPAAADLKSVSAFRSLVAQIELATRTEKESKAKELASQVAKATHAQLVMQINSDLEKIRNAMGDKTSQALEAALDLKYMRDRQTML